MAKYEPKSLRNIAVVGHGGTGKTSLCEAMLFASGKTDRLGRVDEVTLYSKKILNPIGMR